MKAKIKMLHAVEVENMQPDPVTENELLPVTNPPKKQTDFSFSAHTMDPAQIRRNLVDKLLSNAGAVGSGFNQMASIKFQRAEILMLLDGLRAADDETALTKEELSAQLLRERLEAEKLNFPT